MSYDFLKAVLGDELYSQFDEKMKSAQGVSLANISDGSYIPKAKFDEERTNNKNYKQQIDELNTQLTALKQAADGNESLKGQIAQLQQDIAAKEATMKKQQLEFTIRDAVRGSSPRNADVVIRMIDQSKITENNGTLYGLTEQIEALKKSDAYLFAEAHEPAGGVDPQQEPGITKPGSNQAINDVIRRTASR